MKPDGRVGEVVSQCQIVSDELRAKAEELAVQEGVEEQHDRGQHHQVGHLSNHQPGTIPQMEITKNKYP